MNQLATVQTWNVSLNIFKKYCPAIILKYFGNTGMLIILLVLHKGPPVSSQFRLGSLHFGNFKFEANFEKKVLKTFLRLPLHKICRNTGFLCPVIHPEEQNRRFILSLYEKIRFSENPFSAIFCAVCGWIFHTPQRRWLTLLLQKPFLNILVSMDLRQRFSNLWNLKQFWLSMAQFF